MLIGRSLFAGQDALVRMRWNPELERYEGKASVAAPGDRTRQQFNARVRGAGHMTGEMIAKISVSAGGVKESCSAARGLVFRRQ